MLVEAFGDEISMRDAFMETNSVLTAAITGIGDMLYKPGLVGVDFEDVRCLIGARHGPAAVGSATASGTDRAHRAAVAAMTFPLMDLFAWGHECGVLVSITGSASLGLSEYKEVMRTIRQSTDSEAIVIAGAVLDDAMGDQLRVTVVAFGILGRA
jgi:cell division protein FtsZ